VGFEISEQIIDKETLLDYYNLTLPLIRVYGSLMILEVCYLNISI